LNSVRHARALLWQQFYLAAMTPFVIAD